MCLVPANTASRACVWLPHDRVRGCRGLALALMGASRPIPGATIDKPPDPCAHGFRNLTLLGKWWGFCSMRSLATACRRRVAPLLVQFPRLLAVRSRFGAVRSRFEAVRSRFEAVRSRFGAVRRPNRRPPRRKTPTMGCRGRSGLRFGQNYLGHGVLFAREPAIASANQLYRT